MRALRLSSLVLIALMAAAPAWADAATEDGAKQLRDAASAYFSRFAIDQGFISIAPEGDGYRATLDLQRAVDALKLPAGHVSIKPWSLLLTPADNDDWKCATDEFPAVDFDIPAGADHFAGSLQLSGFHFEGVYDSKLAAFVSSATRYAALDLKLHAPNPATGAQDIEFHQAAGTGETKGQDVGDGAVTVNFNQKNDAAAETITTTPPAKDGAPQGAKTAIFNVASTASEGALEGMRASSLRELWTFLVASASAQAAPDRTQFRSDLKARLLAVLPLWNNIAATVAGNGLSFRTEGFTLEATSFSQSLSMSGFSARAKLGVGFKADGVHVVAAAMPPWAEPLAPSAFDIGVSLSDSGFDQIARIAIEAFDPGAANAPIPTAIQQKIVEIVRAGDPKLTIAPSRLNAPGLNLTFQGEMGLATPKPTGRFAVAADGMDKLVAIVTQAAATNPQMQQAVLGLTLVKGLAKQAPDGKLTWDIELGPNGAVAINGVPMPK